MVDVILVSGKAPGVPGSIPGVGFGVSGAIPLGLLPSGSCCPCHLGLGPNEVCWPGPAALLAQPELEGKVF